ncbi:MAG: hypothetical protein ACRD2R_07155, partial [Terriglobales bacterium]
MSAENSPPVTRATALALVGILGAAFALRLGAAQSFPNMLWPDEIYQTLEPAHRLAFGPGIIPWEFREGTR